MQRPYALPLVLLIVALAGTVYFSQGLGLVDSLGLLASGAVAGGSLAAMAAWRRRSP
jgi:hypothetical protein